MGGYISVDFYDSGLLTQKATGVICVKLLLSTGDAPKLSSPICQGQGRSAGYYIMCSLNPISPGILGADSIWIVIPYRSQIPHQDPQSCVVCEGEVSVLPHVVWLGW